MENNKPEQVQYYADDEISLTDIIKTIIKRKKIFWATLILAFFIPFTYAIYKKIQAYQLAKNPESQSVQYISYLAVGFRSANVLIEPLETIELAIKEVYFPESGLDHPINIESNWTKMGNTVKIISTVSTSDDIASDAIRSQHESILTKLLERHNKLYQDMVPKNLSNLTSQAYASPTTIIATAKEVKLSPAEATGFSNKKFIMILAVGFFFSLILGVVSVFMYEFIMNLRRELGESEATSE